MKSLEWDNKQLYQNVSVQFSRSVLSDSLWTHESQHTRPQCPSPTPGVYRNTRPSSWWCHPTISSSVVPFSSCAQPLQHQGVFQWVSSSHQVAKILVISASASVLPMNSQDSSVGWMGWISLQSKTLSRVFTNTIVQKHQLKKKKSINSSALSFLHIVGC